MIATFRTSHDALAAERSLRSRGIGVELIPVPREIASDCGFCLLLATGELRVEAVGLGAEGIWLVEERGSGEGLRKERRYERIA